MSGNDCPRRQVDGPADDDRTLRRHLPPEARYSVPISHKVQAGEMNHGLSAALLSVRDLGRHVSTWASRGPTTAIVAHRRPRLRMQVRSGSLSLPASTCELLVAAWPCHRLVVLRTRPWSTMSGYDNAGCVRMAIRNGHLSTT